MGINELVILRSIFNEELFNAIMNKDLKKVKEIAAIRCKNDIEINNDLCNVSERLQDLYKIEDIDIDIVFAGLEKVQSENLSWAV